MVESVKAVSQGQEAIILFHGPRLRRHAASWFAGLATNVPHFLHRYEVSYYVSQSGCKMQVAVDTFKPNISAPICAQLPELAAVQTTANKQFNN